MGWVPPAISYQGRGERIQNRGVGIILPGLVVVGGRGLGDQKMEVVVCGHQGVKRYDGMTGG